MKRVGVLTSGGDAPGMNAAIRAVVRTATLRDISVVAYLDGYTGLVENQFVELDDRAVGNQIQRGGTFIGSSRCPAFQQPEGRARAAENMRAAGVEGLVVIGGDGSLRGAQLLAKEQGIPVAGVPATIDNDVAGTDEAIGFDTAVNTAVDAIDRVRDTGESTGMMFFVEVMGRTSGAIAMHTAVAAGSAGVLVPEEQEELTRMVKRLRHSIEMGKRSHIIVVAEGDEAGGAFAVGEKVGAVLQHNYRVVVLGHTQRGGKPSMRDRIVASQCGALAIQRLAEGRSEFMVGIQRGFPVEVPLDEVVRGQRAQPRTDLLHLALQLAG